MAEEISNSVASPQLKRQNFAVRANSAMEEKKRAGEEAEDQMIAREKLEEELRVIALATELNISSAISPRDMLMNTTAADFPGDEDEEKRGHDGGIEGQGYSDSLSASSCISGPTPTSSIRAGARIGRTCNTTPATKYKTRSDGLSADGGTSVSPESASSGGASGGQSCEGNSTGMSSAEPYSLTISGDEDDNDSWMRGKRHSRDIGLNETGVRGLGRKAPGDKGRSPSGTGGFLGGAAAGDGLSEETSSSSSATLSLQLPFSEDEAAVLSGLGHTFHLARAGSGVTGGGGGGLSGNGNNAALLAGQGQRSVFFDRLPAEAVRVRMLDLNEELTHLDRCRRTLEVKLRQERAEHETQIEALEKRWLEQIAGLKKEIETLELDRDRLEARLRDKKDMYKDLEVSDALARELRRVPEEDLTIKEYVSLKTYDLVSSSKAELERTRRELEKTQEQLLTTTEAGELQRREDARSRRLATAREEGLKVDLEAFKERAEEMCGRAREAQRAADENRDKARRFDEVEAMLQGTRVDLEAARALSKNQAEALVDMAESEKAGARNAQEAQQRSTMLEMDKTYLQRELSEAQSKADRLGRESEAAADRLRDLERSKDNLSAELVSVRERTRSEHEERLEAEVSRLREQSAKELDDIRTSGREIYERENKALREARTDALQECTRVRSELGELQRAHEDLVMSMAKSDAAHETALGEIRGELRVKGFELAQLGVAHAEKCSAFRQAELELDMLREQVNIHLTEFADLEASTTRKTSELQLLLMSERDKVRAFEDLELEVDGAVMRAGRELLMGEGKHGQTSNSSTNNSNNNNTAGVPGVTTTSLPATVVSGGCRGGMGAVGVGVFGSQEFSAGGGGPALVVPTAPHRRLRQAVLLAQKLLRKEGELEIARTELCEVEQRARALEARATRAEGILHTAEQPTKYMVDSIRSKDGEIETLRLAQRRLVEKVEALERTCREKTEEINSLTIELTKARNTEALKATRAGSETRGVTETVCGSGAPPAKGSTYACEASTLGGVLSEKLTVYGGRKMMADGGPRWYSYRQRLVRVPS